MTDRERLIEIFKKIEYTAFPEMSIKANLANQFTDYALNSIVDEMINSGVIVPPCKVGDTVYFTNEDPRCAAEIDGIHIDENGIAFSWAQYDVGVDTIELWDEGEFGIDEIGKTVFLTFEEFEKALAERRFNDEHKTST